MTIKLAANATKSSVGSAWTASTLHSLAAQLEPNREIVTQPHAVQLLTAALEPPEPPDESRDTSSDEDETDGR